MLTADCAATAKNHGVSSHAFGDDTELHLHCCRADTALDAAELERCAGCRQQTNSSSTCTRLSCCGPNWDTACPSKVVIFQCYSSVPTLLQPTSVYCERRCHQTLASTNTSPSSVRPASYGLTTLFNSKFIMCGLDRDTTFPSKAIIVFECFSSVSIEFQLHSSPRLRHFTGSDTVVRR